MDRRDVLKAGATAPLFALPLASCATGGLDPTVLANIVNGVQQGIAKACAAAGAIVPTATSILGLVNLLIAAAGGTPLSEATAIANIVAQIEKAACPAVPAGAQRDGGTPRDFKLGDPLNPTSVTVNGVVVNFINFARAV